MINNLVNLENQKLFLNTKKKMIKVQRSILLETISSNAQAGVCDLFKSFFRLFLHKMLEKSQTCQSFHYCLKKFIILDFYRCV